MKPESLGVLLKSFPHARFFEKERLLTWHPRGVFNDELADEVVGAIEVEEFHAEFPFHRYMDLSCLKRIEMNVGHVFQIAEKRREAPEPVRSAIFADSMVGYAIARLYEDLMKEAMIRVRAFPQRAAAADWLGVPVSLLEPD